MASIQSVWHDPATATAYANAENATRPSARVLVSKANLSAFPNPYIFDLATGTGAAVHEIYAAVPKEQWGKVKVLGGDVSEPMLAYLKAKGEAEGWSGLEVGVVDGKVRLLLPISYF
jgi:ubiquinone/menaquinone biosynthesis C-methylase UbiE